jgi:DNA N-6-adenine-methyltransferase (Dam)
VTAGQPRLFTVQQEQLTSDDYYTPAWVFERMGLEFDLDVCAPPGGISWIPAKRYFTQADDGLLQPWEGRVWMNPPFSAARLWVPRFLDHRSGVCLLPHAKSKWHIELWQSADGVVNFDTRVNFESHRSDGQVMFPVFFAAFGPECVEAISRLGTVRVVA